MGVTGSGVGFMGEARSGVESVRVAGSGLECFSSEWILSGGVVVVG